MVISGNANGAQIELFEPDRSNGQLEYYRASIRENNFEDLRVYAFDAKNEGLPKFFIELARDWRGWDGTRHWSSLEGEFEINCTHDGLGHVETAAILSRVLTDMVGPGKYGLRFRPACWMKYQLSFISSFIGFDRPEGTI